MKQTFLNSLPDPIGNETFKSMKIKRLAFQTASLGEIYQNVLLALEKLCNQNKFLRTFEEMGKKIGIACDRKYLSIKCQDKKDFLCPSSKKKHF